MASHKRKEYDPILTAGTSGAATQPKFMHSLKCSELKCIHYIYGFHSRDSLESHKRQHHKIPSEPASSSQTQSSLSLNLSEPSPGTGQQRRPSPPPVYIFQRNRRNPLSPGSRPQWEGWESSAASSQDIHPRRIPNTVQTMSTPYSAPALIQPVAEEISRRSSAHSNLTYSFIPEYPASSENIASLQKDKSQHPAKRIRPNTEILDDTRLMREVGPCLRCKILKKKCDTRDPCSLCPEQDSLAEGDYWKVLGCYRGPLVSLAEILVPDEGPIQDQYSRDPPLPGFVSSASERFIANWMSEDAPKLHYSELKDEFGLLWVGNVEAQSQVQPLMPPAYVLIQGCEEGSRISSLLTLSAKLSSSREIELKKFPVLSCAKDMMREAFIFSRIHQSWSKERYTPGIRLYDRYYILYQCARNFLASFDDMTLRRSSLDPKDWIATFCALCFMHATICFLCDGFSLVRYEERQFLGPDSIALESVYKALVSTFMWSTPSLLDDEAASMHYETRELLSDLRLLVLKDQWEEHGIQTTKDFLMEIANGSLDLVSTFSVQQNSAIRPESAGIRTQSPEIGLEPTLNPRVSERTPSALSNFSLDHSTSGNVTLEGASTAMSNKPTYQKSRHERVYCKSCEDHPEGFRGEHELRRHEDRAHRSTIKKWICVQPTDPGSHPVPETLLSKCKSCLQPKKYGRGRSKHTENRGEHEGEDWPPMSELKHWMKEIEEPAEDKPVAVNEERLVYANESSYPRLDSTSTNMTTASNITKQLTDAILEHMKQASKENYQASPLQRCPHPDCGRQFTDLKAHMLTHQIERPEKCPITTCEYHTKGFARKYDKNRHTLSHYRGVLACPFCPGIDTPAQKSFSRADVLKRHLTSAHGVDQAPPSMWNSTASDSVASGKKGKCSICKKEYGGPQAFYEHLNDCVLAVIAPAALVGV
ncbi:hypothetical protein LARI1_G007960 [Lachnellula arida]|uniref:C2H2-type domain-containing protein n=1 Tax=Lachnellula arida TaxID=1316785 RepID=A0A8T9B8Q3_9HELO|nr:hypothetical protein LARI1_G007960 [Lachnellula arida]